MSQLLASPWAAWAPTVLTVVALAALLTRWWLGRGREGAPSSRSRRLARGASLQILVLAAVGLYLVQGPLAPMVATARGLSGLLGRDAPPLAFERVEDGQHADLASLRGQVVLVNVWATWCPPCLRELPALDRLQSTHRGRGLVVLALSDEPREIVAPVLRQRAPNVVAGAGTHLGALESASFRPFTLVIDREGRLRNYAFGEQSYEAFDALVQPLL